MYGSPLSPTERLCIAAIAHGYTIPGFAALCNKSKETVKMQIRCAKIKLGAATLGQMINIAWEKGILPLPAPIAKAPQGE